MEEAARSNLEGKILLLSQNQQKFPKQQAEEIFNVWQSLLKSFPFHIKANSLL